MTLLTSQLTRGTFERKVLCNRWVKTKHSIPRNLNISQTKQNKTRTHIQQIYTWYSLANAFNTIMSHKRIYSFWRKDFASVKGALRVFHTLTAFFDSAEKFNNRVKYTLMKSFQVCMSSVYRLCLMIEMVSSFLLFFPSLTRHLSIWPLIPAVSSHKVFW